MLLMIHLLYIYSVEFLIYFKTLVLLIVLSACGFVIIRRICSELRLQILLPASVILGISLYIFLLNLTAYIFKGPPGFYIALAIEVLLAYFIKRKIKPKEVIIPQGQEKRFWIISLILWSAFLLYISATGPAISGDFLNHTTLASLFARGDFPIHSPFQPDRLSSYHVGGPQLLGAFKSITKAPYNLLFVVFSFVTLLSISQILQWLLCVPKRIFSWILLLLIPAVALISFGNFMFVLPYQFDFPHIQEGLIKWVSKLPALTDSFEPFGSSTSLNSLILFFHRMLSLSIFASILPLALFPNKSKKLLLSGVLIILLSTLALSDETVFIVGTPAIAFSLLFTLFEKNIKQWLLFCFIFVVIVIIQGGLISEVIFKSETSVAKVLIFPDDEKGSLVRFQRYRSFRLEQQSSKLFPDKQEYYPLRWLHPGILWQLAVLIITTGIFTLISRKRSTDKSAVFLIWIFCISAVLSFIAYHIIVPRGMYHINGNRFLALAYHFSGIALIILLILGWVQYKASHHLSKILSLGCKFLLLLILSVSIIPSLVVIFPREKYNWLEIPRASPKAELVWMENNLAVNNRTVAFMEKFPTSGPILDMVKEVGIFTPAWYDKPESQGFEVSPPYLDLFFTLNPQILKILKVEYIMTNKQYRSTLSQNRLADLNNTKYFQPVYNDADKDVIISKVLPQYLKDGENYQGTFYDLDMKLPSRGSFFIESPDQGIVQGVWRVAFLTLQKRDYEIYYSLSRVWFYNFIINVDMKFNGETADKYNYLVLGPDTDPASICHCQTKLFWSQIGGYVKVWKVI